MTRRRSGVGTVPVQQPLLARSLGNPEGQAFAQWHRSEALTACSRTSAGRTAAEEALAIAERIGHRGWTATTLLALGLAHHTDGDLDKAQDAFRRSATMSEHLPLFACRAHASRSRSSAPATSTPPRYTPTRH